MVESYKSDPREECPDCGTKDFEIQRMGVSLYVMCAGECQSSIIGKVDPWLDELDPTTTT